MTKTCGLCGKEFLAERKRRVYCSFACNGKAKIGNPGAKYGRKKSRRVPCSCEKCGKPIDATEKAVSQGRGRYCSRACYFASRVGKPRGPQGKNRAPEERVCPVCKQAFLVGGRVGANRRQRVCSLECQRAGRYRESGKVKRLSPADAAYLAGFIDGEGCVAIIRRGEAKYTLALLVTNTCLEVLRWARKTTGTGNLNFRKRPEQHQPVWVWRCCSGAAANVLEQLAPYLKVKVKQMELAREYRAGLRDPAQKVDAAWQEECRQRMKDLNARGRRANELKTAAV